MREIKFRAWHKGYGLKQPPTMLYDTRSGDCLAWLSQGQPVEVMQYTGLKDKNGKEIYEGDIVRHFGDWGQEYFNEVIHCEGRYSPLVHAEEGHGDSIDSYDPSYYEVIGNIYEHPELLKGGEDVD